MIAIPAARNIAAGEWRLAFGTHRRRAALTGGCLALALSGLALVQMLHAPAMRIAPAAGSDGPVAEAAAAPPARVAIGRTNLTVATDLARAAARKAAAVTRAGEAVAGPGDGSRVDPPAPTALALAKLRDARDILARTAAARHQIECLALNIYFEARSEPDAGKLAVGHVVMNRVADSRFPDDACDVVRQGGEWPRHRCQFSWWCDGKSDRPRNLVAWKRSKALARQIYRGESEDPTGGALWYHADYVAPAWGQGLERAVKIGRHIFYQDRPAAPGVQVATAAYETAAVTQ